MGIWNWLFGKKDALAPTGIEERTPAPATNSGDKTDGKTGERTAASGLPKKPGPADPEAENLRRWRESGQARLWVESHKGSWNHDDWLALLEQLKRSAFWPMQPNAVGALLEDLKRERLRRN